ncbi:hypothetical protein SB719_18935, partial [Pantoea sp. SIMBA_079]|uniref:DUF7507 domain-containing protein n=1 Tax=Pantoea sp. SIMBA_079 TaxID=3085817 RepID=UPI0039961DB0
MTCTADYTATQADLDAGSISNTATATATAPAHAVNPVSNASTAVVSATAGPSLTLVKSSTLDGSATAGDTVTYAFQVSNTGNVTVHGITVDDTAFSGTGTLSAIDCPNTTVAPGADVTCRARYTLTQADVDAGELTNSATATGTTPGGDPVTAARSDNTLPLPAAPKLSLVKSAAPAAPADFAVGEQITYSFAVTNARNV